MNILLIDDLRVPGAAENKKNIPADAVVARNYNDGIALLQSRKWDALYLDHDLADFSGPEGRERKGIHVLDWLEDFPEHLPGEIILVTDNASGLGPMRRLISKLYGGEY
jgi:hypothetical protein